MGMFDTICNVPVKCPRCGDEGPKPVQFKCGPQTLSEYEFGKDRIKVNWAYEFYGSIIDEEKKVIGGIATCDSCKEESNEMMGELVQEAKNKGELNYPEGAELLIECEIDGKDALGVILQRLDDVYGGNRNIELFDVAIQLDKDNIPIFAGPIEEGRLKEIEEIQKKRIEERTEELRKMPECKDPILIEDGKIKIDPEKLKVGKLYKFQYLGAEMALKKSTDGSITLYEIDD